MMVEGRVRRVVGGAPLIIRISSIDVLSNEQTLTTSEDRFSAPHLFSIMMLPPLPNFFLFLSPVPYVNATRPSITPNNNANTNTSSNAKRKSSRMG